MLSYNQKAKHLEAIFIDKHHHLVTACKTGDRKAHYELYKLYSKAMFNISLRMLNNYDEAQDVLQEAFVDAFNRIKDFRQETTFGLWLKQIVIHRSINALRKRKIEFTDIDEVDVADDRSEEADEDDIIFKVQEIKEAIKLLPEGYRVVLSLYLLEGYDHEEIAQILKISEGTSRSQFLRAKKKLIILLKERGAIT